MHEPGRFNQHRASNCGPLLVGSEHDFVLVERWPRGVAFIDNNIFDVTRAFPIRDDFTNDCERCGCIGWCSPYRSKTKSACINAQTCTVCDDLNCSAGVSCGNRFMPRYTLNLFKGPVGYGVVTEEFIPSGAFVTEYVGELLYCEDAVKRENKQYVVELRTSTVNGETLFVDARRCGNASRLINHSCAPNCIMEEWNWANTVRLGIFAARDLRPLTELTFAYRGAGTMLFTCACQAPTCKSRSHST